MRTGKGVHKTRPPPWTKAEIKTVYVFEIGRFPNIFNSPVHSVSKRETCHLQFEDVAVLVDAVGGVGVVEGHEALVAEHELHLGPVHLWMMDRSLWKQFGPKCHNFLQMGSY